MKTSSLVGHATMLVVLSTSAGFLRRETTSPMSFPWFACLAAPYTVIATMGLSRDALGKRTKTGLVVLSLACQVVANFKPELRLFTLYPEADHPGNIPLFPVVPRPTGIYNYDPHRPDPLAHITMPPTKPIPPKWPNQTTN